MTWDSTLLACTAYHANVVVYITQTGHSIEIRIEEHCWHICLKNRDKSTVAKDSINLEHKIQLQYTSTLSTRYVPCIGWSERQLRSNSTIPIGQGGWPLPEASQGSISFTPEMDIGSIHHRCSACPTLATRPAHKDTNMAQTSSFLFFHPLPTLILFHSYPFLFPSLCLLLYRLYCTFPSFQPSYPFTLPFFSLSFLVIFLLASQWPC